MTIIIIVLVAIVAGIFIVKVVVGLFDRHGSTYEVRTGGIVSTFTVKDKSRVAEEVQKHLNERPRS
jgi:hypothetical protein